MSNIRWRGSGHLMRCFQISVVAFYWFLQVSFYRCCQIGQTTVRWISSGQWIEIWTCMYELTVVKSWWTDGCSYQFHSDYNFIDNVMVTLQNELSFWQFFLPCNTTICKLAWSANIFMRCYTFKTFKFVWTNRHVFWGEYVKFHSKKTWQFV